MAKDPPLPAPPLPLARLEPGFTTPKLTVGDLVSESFILESWPCPKRAPLGSDQMFIILLEISALDYSYNSEKFNCNFTHHLTTQMDSNRS